MRTLYTLLFAALSFGAFSQNNSIHLYPWNPDANQDNEIGMGDLLSFLSVFGEEYGLPPEPCTYDGSELEEWCLDIYNNEIVLDSMFIEYQLQDIGEYFNPGCPDMVIDTVYFTNYGMMFNNTNSITTSSHPTNILGCEGTDAFSNYQSLALVYSETMNEYKWMMYCSSIYELYNSNEVFSGGSFTETLSTEMPWPDYWEYNEAGITLLFNNGWGAYANYIHIIPYWHYADE